MGSCRCWLRVVVESCRCRSWQRLLQLRGASSQRVTAAVRGPCLLRCQLEGPPASSSPARPAGLAMASHGVQVAGRQQDASRPAMPLVRHRGQEPASAAILRQPSPRPSLRSSPSPCPRRRSLRRAPGTRPGSAVSSGQAGPRLPLHRQRLEAGFLQSDRLTFHLAPSLMLTEPSEFRT